MSAQEIDPESGIPGLSIGMQAAWAIPVGKRDTGDKDSLRPARGSLNEMRDYSGFHRRD
jgi:hypothetical protein